MPQNNQTRLYGENQFEEYCNLIRKGKTVKGLWASGKYEAEIIIFKKQFTEKALKRMEERAEREGVYEDNLESPLLRGF